ncbi:hypothetical protein COY95_00720 [Candidatus Woesearchaeota archaeon CG_4_10_14_0_8_um_filter_47_5]|nr:MAG: hypothetical protein COY95_00720 [Candidatus Woesearchaeota archaeon CG_4_10_14_0_8_um_filter_47_5]
MAQVSRDTPLSEITLRRYEKPTETKTRTLLRKFCLSFGLLNPGDSRDVIIDLLYVLLKARKQKKALTSREIEKQVIGFRQKCKVPMLGVAPSNIRRQLLRMRDLSLVEKVKNTYRITEFLPLEEIFVERLQKFLLPVIIERVKEYCTAADKSFEG